MPGVEATKAFFNHAGCFCLHFFSSLEGIRNELLHAFCTLTGLKENFVLFSKLCLQNYKRQKGSPLSPFVFSCQCPVA